MREQAADRLRIETLTTETAFAGVADPWDDLVSAMPRPSPFLLNSWLAAWWDHYGANGRLAVIVAYRGERLVAGLPLWIRRRLGLDVLEFVGGTESAPLADLMLAHGEGASTAAAVGEHAAAIGHDFASLFGLSRESRLVAALPSGTLHLVQRLEAPVLDLKAGWKPVYEAKLPSKARANRRRRRRQLEALGDIHVCVARTSDELGPALDDAFRLHELRWHGRRDPSEFATHTGRRFYREAVLRLAPRGIPRLVTIRLAGRPIAFALYLQLERALYGVTMAFDPAFARFAPGSEALLVSLETAADEGVERAEFLGAAGDHKRRLTDRIDPIYQGLGLAGSAPGHVAANALVAGVQLRRRAKRSETARRLYYRIPRTISLPKLSSYRRRPLAAETDRGPGQDKSPR